MTYLSLLIDDVVIFNPDEDSSGEDYSRYGDEGLDFDAGTASKARVMQEASNETAIDRDTRVQVYKVYLPAGVTLSALSYLEWEGKRLRLDGEPEYVDGRAGVHHVECKCQEVLG